jgi:hypothetical protein
MSPKPATKVAEPPSISEIDARLRAVERLISIFRVERYVYLGISILSFFMLIGFAVYMFVTSNEQGRSQLFTLLFLPPAGAVLYVSGAFLRMWSQALAIFGKANADE